VEYFTFQNVLTIGGVMLFVAVWAAIMIVFVEDSSTEGKSQDIEVAAPWKIKLKSVLRSFGFIIAVLNFTLLTLACLLAAIHTFQEGEILNFLGSTLEFIVFSIVTIFFLFHKTNWVRVIMSGSSLRSRVIYGIVAWGFIGSLVLRVVSTLAK
jgi:hypothetical protein